MYKCRECGYRGKKLIFQFTDYSFCVASNEDEPDLIDSYPKWVKDMTLGESEVGEPIGCPKCRAWGEHNFEIIS